MKYIQRLSILIAFWLISSSASTLAVPKPGVTLDPYIKELSIQAASEGSNFDLKITNNSGKTGAFKLVAVDFGTLNDSGGLLFAGINENQLLKKYGLAHWLSLPADPVMIDQGQTVTVPVSIVNSASLSPGGHYGAIFITPNFGDTSAKIKVNQTISCLVLAVKHGGDVYDLRLNFMSDNHKLFKTPSKANLSFHNPGNVHVVPRGIVTLRQGSKEIARGILNQESGFVLPETDRKYDVELHSEHKPNSGLFMTTYELKADYRYDGYDYFASNHYFIHVYNIRFIVLSLLLVTILVVKFYKVKWPQKQLRMWFNQFISKRLSKNK